MCIGKRRTRAIVHDRSRKRDSPLRLCLDRKQGEEAHQDQ